MVKIVISVVLIILGGYALMCFILYKTQEEMIFFPESLRKDYQFGYAHAEEKWISVRDGIKLHGLMFKANQSKGLIYYLHGNARSVRSWGEVARTYTDLHYDVFILDYRGYGKSEGKISSEEQLVNDAIDVYVNLKTLYKEDSIVILGYSLGTGLAIQVAARNKSRLLILQTPYYSMVDMVKIRMPFVPASILKYKLETNTFIENCTMPIVIFHGDADEIIPVGGSLKLKPLLKRTDRIFILQGQGHNGMTYNPDYLHYLKEVL